MDEATRSSPQDYDRMAAGMNNAALVFAYLGDVEVARQVCEGELSWIAGRLASENTGHAGLVRLSVDPWVNLGRLLAFQGETDKAIEHFTQVFSLNSSLGCVTLGPCRISHSTWNEVGQLDRRLVGATRAIYLIDSTKALLLVEDYKSALEFLSTLSWARQTSLRWLLSEGILIASLRLRPHEDLLPGLEEASRGSLYYQAVTALHSCENLMRQDEAKARQILRGLVYLIDGQRLVGVHEPSMLRFLVKLGTLLEQLDESEYAHLVYLRGRELANSLSDQPSQHLFLKGLLRLGAHEKSHDWVAELQRLVAACDYYSVRRSEGIKQDPWNCESIYYEMLHLIETITESTIVRPLKPHP